MAWRQSSHFRGEAAFGFLAAIIKLFPLCRSSHLHPRKIRSVRAVFGDWRLAMASSSFSHWLQPFIPTANGDSRPVRLYRSNDSFVLLRPATAIRIVALYASLVVLFWLTLLLL